MSTPHVPDPCMCVCVIAGNPAMFNQWKQELTKMSGRIKEMRTALYDELVRLNTPSPSGDWKHVISKNLFGQTSSPCIEFNHH